MIKFKPKSFAESLFYALIFANIFVAMGHFIPLFYYRYVDTRVYYNVSQPMQLDKKIYTPCETTIITAQRDALVPIHINFTTQLVKVESSKLRELPSTLQKRESIVEVGDKVISTEYKLPCDLKDGVYFWEVLAEYKIRGVEKSTYIITESFTVEKDTEK